ncbi:hypothetical protein BDQ17DRAFT_1545218 [Cyathus striatus]|nr:hypothetical protein BDQ17DRAFT_1545218 [Cyathus striatus]
MATDPSLTAPLRVLYTINSSPQYILARSLSSFPIFPVPPQSPSEFPIYATVSLRKCLDTICRSSPELLQDTSRDFSVYVLDPLESNSAPAPVNISNSNQAASSSNNAPNTTEQSRGVAVGLGLMSWVLQADENDSPTVAGTLIKQGTTQLALEVIFALRETVTMTKPSASTAFRSWYTPQTSAGLKKSTSLTFLSNAVSGSTSSQVSSASYKLLPDASITNNSNNSTSPSAHTSKESRSFSVSTASAETLATIASIYSRTKAKEVKPKPKKSTRISSVPLTGSDLLLVPETYIGPQKKKGRPRGSNIDDEAAPTPCTDEIIVIDDTSDDNGPIKPQDPPSDAHEALPESKSTPNSKRRKKKCTLPDNSTPPFSVGPLIRNHTKPAISATTDIASSNDRKAEPTLHDLISLISTSVPPGEVAQNAAVLAALNAIDTPAQGSRLSHAEANPNLVGAIRQLLSMYSQQSGADSLAMSSSYVSQSAHHQQDEEIIVLDKENVNPGAFKRKAERDFQEAKLAGTTTFPATLESPVVEADQSRGLSIRSNENSAPKAKAFSNPTNSTTNIRRKRTLSEFMDEKELQARSKGKGRDRGRMERKEARHDNSHHYRHLSSSGNGMRHYSRLLAYNQPRPPSSSTSSYYNTGFDPWTSPPRANRPEQREIEDDHNEEANSTLHSVRVARVSASSPIRQNSAVHVRKKYIVPEWARTTTALQPRLSEEAQHALHEAQERRKKEKVARKGRERVKQKTNPKLSNLTYLDNGPSSSQASSVSTSTSTSTSASVPLSSEFLRPIAPSSDCPVFAFPGLPPFSTSSSCQSSRSPSPSPRAAAAPKTPTREKRSFRLASGGERDSLFTPLTNSHGPHSVGNGCSPLFSPFIRGVPESPLSKKNKMSPIQSVVQGRGLPLNGGWGSPSMAENRNSNRPPADDEDDLEAALSKEMKITKSSSREADTKTVHIPVNSQSDVQETESADEDEVAERRRQLKEQWATLPPSSPPPPTSPGLIPQEDDGNDFEINNSELDSLKCSATASEPDFDPRLFDTDKSPAMNETSPYSDEEMTLMTCLDEQLNSFLSEMEDEGLDAKSTPTELDIFEQFTTINAQSSDGLHPADETGFGSILQNGLQNMDFSEFWETFKPLIQQEGIEAATGSETGPMLSYAEGSTERPADHAKLADDVYALFSGCLM